MTGRYCRTIEPLRFLKQRSELEQCVAPHARVRRPSGKVLVAEVIKQSGETVAQVNDLERYVEVVGDTTGVVDSALGGVKRRADGETDQVVTGFFQ